MQNSSEQTNTSFYGLGIAPKLLQILEQQGFKEPTPIQFRSIPIAIEGKDLMGIAQTGTGKTLAFGIPMLQRLAGNQNKGLIIVPTRELAVQVNDSLQKIGKSIGLKTAVLIGGESIGRQIAALRQQPRIIIATPGRLIDHLESKSISAAQVSILVLDEADRMLDMGFAPQLRKIMQYVPKQRQTMLFSATMDAEIVRIASSYMQLPIRVEVAPAGSTASMVTQELFFVAKPDKPEMLKTILAEYKGSVLVFSRTKFGAKKITHFLRAAGQSAAEIHSNRSLSQRLEALEGFKNGKYRVLVATDIAARGIDVRGIEVVINFDLPENASDYVHRIGRTGRAGHAGHAISLATPDQRHDVYAIERLIQKPLPVSKTPKLERSAQSFAGNFSQRDEERPRRPQYGSYRRDSAPQRSRTGFSSPSRTGSRSDSNTSSQPQRRNSYRTPARSGSGSHGPHKPSNSRNRRNAPRVNRNGPNTADFNW